MKIPEINLDKHQLFVIAALFLIGLGWLGLLLALFGIFFKIILVAYVLLSAVILACLVWRHRQKIDLNRRFLSVILLSLAAVFVFSNYASPTIFSGRDQGSLSEAAIRLSQNHKLEFSSPASQEFFKIYGFGKALNFPGFNYTPNGGLTTQFPLGYVSWLAIFFAFFGINGLIVANGASFLLFLFSFYLLARLYSRFSSAIAAILLVLTSFIFSWFFKFTLSENLALALVWFGILEFMLFVKHEKRFHLLASFLSFGLLAFVRIEALAFLAVAIIILYFKFHDWKRLFFSVIGKGILFFLGGFAALYFFHLAFVTKSILPLLKDLLSPFISLGSGLRDYSSSDSVSFWETALYTIRVLFTYSLFNYILFAIAGFLYFSRHKRVGILLPFLIVLPSFAYIIHPSISADHPWMLRRFVFSVIPACILYSIWFFESFLKKRAYFYLLALLLLAANLFVFVPYLTAVPNKDLLPQIQAFSTNFADSDLVLVDQDATGDGWSMMSGPLSFYFGKQAVYFFNPLDLKKIDLKKFSSVYFIIPDNNLDFYGKNGILEKLVPVRDYKITATDLNSLLGEKQELFGAPVKLPEKRTATIYGKIYLLTQ